MYDSLNYRLPTFTIGIWHNRYCRLVTMALLGVATSGEIVRKLAVLVNQRITARIRQKKSGASGGPPQTSSSARHPNSKRLAVFLKSFPQK